MKNHILLFALFASHFFGFAQSEEIEIRKTLLNYINGTSYNNLNEIDAAFYEDANLYLDSKDEPVWVVPIKEYTKWFTKNQGEFNGRVGNIISIDHFNSIATAKAEIIIPSKSVRFVDLFLLKKMDGIWKIISKSASRENSNLTGKKVLFIVSNQEYYGTSDIATGNSFSEIVIAHQTFVNAGYSVDFVSPNGGSIPLAYINTADPLHRKYIYNQDVMYALKTTKRPNEIVAKDYKAVHYIGGGSSLFGVPENKEIQQISMDVYEEYGGVVSSVCHGTAGIVHLKTKDGQYLVKGKNVNGFPDAHENSNGEYFKHFPFLIQKTIEARGGKFRYSQKNKSHVEVDGNLVTGQNYNSSEAVAEKVIAIIENGL